MISALKKILSSSKFLVFLMLVFVLQSVWYSASIKYRIPPDERYHYQVTNYYAESPILSGPIITEQKAGTFILGDLERTPSYLYHYLMSFPLRAIKPIVGTENKQVIVLRLINLSITSIGLFVLYKIMRKIKLSNLQINIIFLMLSITGMFVWMGAVINYDSLSQLLFWASLYLLILIIDKPKILYVIGFSTVAMATVITKITFAPILLFALLTTVVIVLKNKKIKINQLKSELNFSNKKLLLVFMSFILIGVLFAERIGGNLINYGAITPACDSLHSKEECLNNGGYARSIDQARIVQEMKDNGETLDVILGEFTANWFQLMYDRIYFYLGHKQMQPTAAARTIAFITFIFVIVLISINRKKVVSNSYLVLLSIVTISFVLLLYFYNLSAYIDSWAKFGYQGRYLLPVIPFVYIFSVLLFFNLYRGTSLQGKRTLISLVIVLGLLNIYHHAPALVFMRGSDSSWYTTSTVGLNEKIGTVLERLYLIDKKSVEYLESPD